MTKREILLNYNQAIKQATKLDQSANRLERLAAEQLGSAVGTLQIAWQSDSSPQYYGKVGKVQGDIRATAGKLRKIANSIRITAGAVKKADLRALEIAQARMYR